MSEHTLVDAERLRVEVRDTYRAIAAEPAATYHCYDTALVDGFPDLAMESFAGVANPLALRTPAPGDRVVDVGSGDGFDSFVAAAHVGPSGHVVGVDMTAKVLAFADIASGRPIPAGALRDIDLWTGCIAGGLPCAGWQQMLEEAGFVDVPIGDPVDTFGGAGGEANARAYEVLGYRSFATKPWS